LGDFVGFISKSECSIFASHDIGFKSGGIVGAPACWGYCFDGGGRDLGGEEEGVKGGAVFLDIAGGS
jgi:hypothetical protein